MNSQSAEKKDFLKTGDRAIIVLPSLEPDGQPTHIPCRIESIRKEKKNRTDKHAKVVGALCLYVDSCGLLHKMEVHPKLLTKVA